MIHKVEYLNNDIDVYVISSNHIWKPGCYDTKRTANYAFRFSDKELFELQESINPNGIITYNMLKEIKLNKTNNNDRQCNSIAF